MKKICKNCKWFDSVLIEPRPNCFYRYEYCHRYPPHPVHGLAHTTENNKCGEWAVSAERLKNAPLEEL